LFCFVCSVAVGQNDTINKLDSLGRKQGLWKTYYDNGTIKWEITYKDDVANGYAKAYYESGCVREEGNWKEGKWVGTYKNYYLTCNHLYLEITYDSTGENGYVKYYEMNGKIGFEGKQSGWNQKTGKTTDSKTKPEPTFGSPAKLYNSKKQLVMDGTFKNYKLIDGKEYVYDTNGKLIQIKVYKNGAYVDDVPIVPDAPKVTYKTKWDSVCALFSKEDSMRIDSCTLKGIKGGTSSEKKKEKKKYHKNEDMQSLFDGKGWAKLFNMNKQISKDGYFWNYKLVIGFDYIYDKEGNLVQIAKFFKGKQIGECPVK